MGYLVKSAYHQVKILNSRVEIDEILKTNTLSDQEKEKLLLTQDVRKFADLELKLNAKKNYTTYVKLDRPYVSYVISASPKWKLESYLWGFPIIGNVPYKGFFSEAEANEEATELGKKNYDTYVRGVSAYSTLGWFKDPLLSSMLKYSNHDLVNTIIHESVHATLYIKSEADFNEQLASFLGAKGMELYYLSKEGSDSKTVKIAQDENQDEHTFSSFITNEINELELWYNQNTQKTDDVREKKFKDIQDKFVKDILPKMKTNTYSKFAEIKLNNARLIVYKTYLKDMSDFNDLYHLSDNHFVKFLEHIKTLEKSNNPKKDLKDLIISLKEKHQQG